MGVSFPWLYVFVTEALFFLLSQCGVGDGEEERSGKERIWMWK